MLDIDGRGVSLNRYTTGRITLLSFMYTYCVDPIGCPLAYQTLSSLRERLLAKPNLARQVRFVSLSFDPINDTPAAMKSYGGKLADATSDIDGVSRDHAAERDVAHVEQTAAHGWIRAAPLGVPATVPGIAPLVPFDEQTGSVGRM